MQGKIKCTKCNNMIAIGTVFCPFCGSEQAPSGNATENISSRRRRGAHNVPIIKTGEDVMVPVKVKEVTVPKEKPEETTQKTSEAKDAETETVKSSDTEIKVEDSVIKSDKNDVDASEAVQQQMSADTAPINSDDVDITSYEEKEQNTEEAIKQIIEEVQSSASESDTELDDQKNDSDDTQEKKRRSKLKEKKNQKNVEYELYHDTLTSCLNRKAYEERLKEVCSDQYCIIVADANNLKRTNDSLGHANGDILITAIAQSLQAVFGIDNCYRTGGDEFAVILEGIDEDVVKERIERFHIDLKGRERKQRENGAQIDMKAAIGYAYGKKVSNIKDVCKKADANMYEDKHKIKQVYDPNYDGYYNDVKVQYEEMKVDIDRENLHKALLVILALIIFMIFYFVFIF